MGEVGIAFWFVCPFHDLILPTTCPSSTPHVVGIPYQCECAPFHSDTIFMQNVNNISCSAVPIFILCDLKDNRNMPNMFPLSCFRRFASGDGVFQKGAIWKLVGKQVGQCAHHSTLPSDSVQSFWVTTHHHLHLGGELQFALYVCADHVWS